MTATIAWLHHDGQQQHAAEQTVVTWGAGSAARGAFLVKIEQQCGVFRRGWTHRPRGDRLDQHLAGLCVAQAVQSTPGMTPQALQTLRAALRQDSLRDDTLAWTHSAAP